MYDYEELIARLREADQKSMCGECGLNLHSGATKKGVLFAEAADVIERLFTVCERQKNDVMKLARYLAEASTKIPKWISVEVRMPEPFVPVLVHIPGDRPFPTVREAFIEKTGLWYSTGFRYEQEEVTHWCEMPEPPKEDAECKN